MRTNFNRLILTSALGGTLLVASGVQADAQTNSTAASLTGTWTMSLIGDHVIPVGLALQQDGATLTGTLTMMGKDIPLKGELAGRAITLTGSAMMMMRDHGATEGTAAPGPSPAPMKFTGVVQEDGTLSGEMAAPRGPMKWTADRLKERAATRTNGPDTAQVLGSWNVSVIADHAIPVGLLIEPDGARMKATLTIMGGDVPLTGEYGTGGLALSGEFGDDISARTGMKGAVKITAKMRDDGSIAGEFTMSRGTFPLTGERLKERAPKAPATR